MARSKRHRIAQLASAIERFASLTASRDIEVIKQVISDRYGFTPTDTYCSDLIAFIEALTDGQQGNANA